jgi:hypothetical protein
MSSRIRVVVLSTCLLAVLVPNAEGKELQAVTICGEKRCVEVPSKAVSIDMLGGGYTTSAPERAEPYYRVRFRIGGGGHHESFGRLLLPRAGYLADTTPAGVEWSTLASRQTRRYRRLVAELKPIPKQRVAQLLASEEPGETPLRPASEQRAAAPTAPGEPAEQPGDRGIAIGGTVAAIALLGLAALSLHRLRRR